MGGYWRPLAAVARLLEELGELSEGLASPHANSDELASELADLWIITTAVADQFLGEVVEPATHAPEESDGRQGASHSTGVPVEPFGELVAAAGLIARIVNYYDGPKTPRSLAGWPSLSDAVAEFHRALATVAGARGVCLGVAVADKLDAIPVRDSARFKAAEHDPSTAPCLEQFRLIQTTIWGADIGRARLWGAPAWSAQSLASNVAASVPSLLAFTRAAIRERLEGYVVAGSALGSQLLGGWAGAVLGELASQDPQLGSGARASVDDPAAADALLFNGVLLSAAVFPAPRPHILLRPSAVE